jgi:hypothetical protein
MSVSKRLQLDQTISTWRILRAPYTRAFRPRQANSRGHAVLFAIFAVALAAEVAVTWIRKRIP